jgi:hypothetical protein
MKRKMKPPNWQAGATLPVPPTWHDRGAAAGLRLARPAELTCYFEVAQVDSGQHDVPKAATSVARSGSDGTVAAGVGAPGHWVPGIVGEYYLS